MLLSKFMLGGAIDLTASSESARGLQVDGDVSKIFERNMRDSAAIILSNLLGIDRHRSANS